jgi:hypothetical protein
MIIKRSAAAAAPAAAAVAAASEFLNLDEIFVTDFAATDSAHPGGGKV